MLSLLSLGGLAGCAFQNRPLVPTERQEFSAPRDILRLRWQKPLLTQIPLLSYKPQEFATAAIATDEQTVFIGSSTKKLIAFDIATGQPRWDRVLSSSISSQLLYVPAGVVSPDALLVVGEDAGAVSAFQANTGQLIWSYRTRGPVQAKPVVHGTLIYLTSNEGRIYALDVRSGAWKWQYDRETADTFSVRGQSGVLVHKNRVYVGFPDGTLSCLSAENGEVVWNQRLAGETSRFTDADGTPAVLGDLLIASCYAGGLFGLNLADGTTRWRFELDAAGQLTVDPVHERVFAVSATSGLFAIDKKGRKLWQQVMRNHGELAAPTLWGPYLLLSSATSGMALADADTGELLQFLSPGLGISAAPVALGQDVFVLTNAGVFFALTHRRSPRTPGLIAHRRDRTLY